MASYKTKAIVINRLNLGESDRILTLFSPEYGKIRSVCKGGRRTKSKFGGHTELFSYCDFVISEGKNLDILSDSCLITNFLADKPDMEKIKTAYYFAEVINRLLPDKTPNREVFDLYLFCLENIYQIPEKLLQLIFVAKLLKILGIYPELSVCVKCEHKPNKDDLYFSKMAGGIIDQTCSLHFEDAIRTDENTIKLWRYLADSPASAGANISTSETTIAAANLLAIEYIHCVTQIDYKSLRVLS